MSTLEGLALRLHGPLQAWGGAVVGDDRPSLHFPTRSGVLGLVAACMGIRRSETDRLMDLARDSRVHVRVDAAGVPMVDDQTIQGNPNASTTRQTIQSKRTYLCDASFAAVLVPGPAVAVEAIVTALRSPVFAPYLGRRACVPSSPLLLAERVVASDILDLFKPLPRGPAELVAGTAETDYYLDAIDHPLRLRRLPVRDVLAGPLPRQFRERSVVHVRLAGAPAVDPWMTRELA